MIEIKIKWVAFQRLHMEPASYVVTHHNALIVSDAFMFISYLMAVKNLH